MPAHTTNDVAGSLRPPVAARERQARAGVALAGVAAAIASAGLVWWLASDPDQALRGAIAPQSSGQAAAEAPLRPFAPPDANEEQVRRAYDEMRQTYADGGLEAVDRSAEICAGSVSDHPDVLDYCLAFSLYAQALQPQSAASARRARLDMARAALPPNADATARILEVRRLSRAVTGEQASAAPAAPPTVKAGKPVRAAGAGGNPKRARSAVTKAAVRAKPNQPGRRTASACRLKSTPMEQTLCANPGLQAADRRMRAAYNKALAAGANRSRLAEDQEAWRAEARAAGADRLRLGGLFEQRTRDLQEEVRQRQRAARGR